MQESRGRSRPQVRILDRTRSCQAASQTDRERSPHGFAAGRTRPCKHGTDVRPRPSGCRLHRSGTFRSPTWEPRATSPAIDACTPRGRSGPLGLPCFSSLDATQTLRLALQGMEAQSSQPALGGLAAHAGDGCLATASLSHWRVRRRSGFSRAASAVARAALALKVYSGRCRSHRRRRALRSSLCAEARC